MSNSKTQHQGFADISALVGFLLAIALAVTLYLLLKPTALSSPANIVKKASISNTSNNPYSTLAPATVPSKAAECSTTISFSSNGDSGPIQCTDGYLNSAEWTSLATLEPQVMTLGYSATISQVETALCNDVHANIANVIEETNYQISALYYGWNFSTSPTSVITGGACVNVDD
jgi:hypothetical protein